MDPSLRSSLRGKTVTLQEIAARCGVCKATVSLALRHSPKIPATTVARIQAAADALGYRPDPTNPARRLSLRKTGQDIIKHLIAAFVPVPQATYFLQLLRGILEELTPAGYAVVLADLPLTPGDAATAELPHIFASNELDGIIVANGHLHTQLIERIRQLNPHADWPLVSMIYPLAGSSVVMTDDRDGAYRSACHLLEQGHRHLLQCVFPEVPGRPFEPSRRLEGVRQALQERALDPERHLRVFPLDPAWYTPNIFTFDDDNQRLPSLNTSAVKERFLACLRAHPEVTGILALNDACALNIWDTLAEVGVRIPEQISLIGFDDTDPYSGERGRNLLTSVRLPLREIGRDAARLIMQRITGELEHNVEHTCPVRLMVRRSTMPPG